MSRPDDQTAPDRERPTENLVANASESSTSAELASFGKNAQRPQGVKRRRRWTSISLRGLMVLVLIVGGLMGWQARRASLQRRAVERIKALHGSVEYDWQYPGPDFLRTTSENPPGPVWLRRMIGDEYFQDVAAVSLPDEPTPPPRPDEDFIAWRAKYERPLLEDQLACLDGLDRLKSLRLEHGHLRPEGLARLSRQTRLEYLTLIIDDLDAEGLAALGRLTELESLRVSAMSADAGDLAFLERLTKLRSLHILSGFVTDAGLDRIARCDRLKSLSIVGPELTDAGLAHLERLKDLESLKIRRARSLTEVGLAHLIDLTGLRSIDFPETPLNEAGLEHLCKLPRLTKLSIGNGLMVNPGTIERLVKERPGLTVELHPPPSPDEKKSPFDF